MSEPEIQKVLVLSTAHMTSEDSELATEYLLPCIGACDEGFTFRAALTDEYGRLDAVLDLNEAMRNGYSMDLQRVLLYAVELGCKFVRFDRDAGIVDGLDTFEW